MNFYTLFFLLFYVTFLNAQNFSLENLQRMEDEELLSLFNKVEHDSLKAEVVARVYLTRARKEKDTIKMARGYDRLARIFHPEKNIMFADSVITLTEGMENKTYPAMGYLLKYLNYNSFSEFKLEFENAIKCYELAVKNKNITQQLYISDYLIKRKLVWGDKLEALRIQREKSNLMNTKEYIQGIEKSSRKGVRGQIDQLLVQNELSSIGNYVFCFLNLKVYDSAFYYQKKGTKKLQEYNGSDKLFFQEWFEECLVEIEFYNCNYEKSIKLAKELLTSDKYQLSIFSLFNLNFFCGYSYLKMGETEIGMKYLKVADSYFMENEIAIQPYHRLLFEMLLEHYRNVNDINKEIKYLNKLLFVDSIFKTKYKFFEPNIIKTFETPKLLREKESLILELESKNKKSNLGLWVGGFLVLVVFVAGGYYFQRQKIFKTKFEKLIKEKESQINIKPKKGSSTPEISSSVLKDILKKIDAFETKKQFLSQTISLHSLAKKFGTNSRYLSSVINLEKEKNFPTYINDLRVDYALQQLNENDDFKKFTIKAIAGECGFKSSESFSKAFYNRHGVYPSYYIKKLKTIKK